MKNKLAAYEKFLEDLKTYMENQIDIFQESYNGLFQGAVSASKFYLKEINEFQARLKVDDEQK